VWTKSVDFSQTSSCDPDCGRAGLHAPRRDRYTFPGAGPELLFSSVAPADKACQKCFTCVCALERASTQWVVLSADPEGCGAVL
jgi:hypothetical protein